MNKHIYQRGIALAALLAPLAPAVALAEEENKGLALLLPNMAEFVPACIAFIIIFILLSKLAWPTVLKTLEAREQKIQGDLDAAEKAKADAQANAQTYEQKLQEAKSEAEDILSQARKEAEEERSRILAEAQKDAAATIAKARDAVSSERKKAMIELSGQVVDLSVEIASKIIGDSLSEDQQRRLAEKYLAEVSAPHDA